MRKSDDPLTPEQEARAQVAMDKLITAKMAKAEKEGKK